MHLPPITSQIAVLPVKEKTHKSLWKTMHITWITQPSKERSFAKAKLPENWSMHPGLQCRTLFTGKKGKVSGTGYHSFTLCENKIPKIEVVIKGPLDNEGAYFNPSADLSVTVAKL